MQVDHIVCMLLVPEQLYMFKRAPEFAQRVRQYSPKLASSITMSLALANLLSTATMLKELPLDQRIDALAGGLNPILKAFDMGEVKEGVQTFQEGLVKILTECHLCDPRWVDVSRAGVRPRNREGAGLVPIDVHDLLLRITMHGWSWQECAGALAAEIPPDDKGGAAWRDFNYQLAKKSDGMLAPCAKDDLEIATARGSHTTAGLRAMLLGARGIHPQLCIDGSVSKSKIMEIQPSMAQPLERGMRYSVVKWQIVCACPLLMPLLSRTGNASHGVAREQTALQACKRLHSLHTSLKATSANADVTEQVIRIACVGMDPDYEEVARNYLAFVEKWSGGQSGHILASLEEYERALMFKRKIYSLDLKQLSTVSLIEA